MITAYDLKILFLFDLHKIRSTVIQHRLSNMHGISIKTLLNFEYISRRKVDLDKNLIKDSRHTF